MGGSCCAFRLKAPMPSSPRTSRSGARSVTVRSDSPESGASREMRLGFSKRRISSVPAAAPPSALAKGAFITSPPSILGAVPFSPRVQKSSRTPKIFTPFARRLSPGTDTVPCTSSTGTAPGTREASSSVKNPSAAATAVPVFPSRISAWCARVARTESPVTSEPAITAAAAITPRASPACQGQ